MTYEELYQPTEEQQARAWAFTQAAIAELIKIWGAEAIDEELRQQAGLPHRYLNYSPAALDRMIQP